MTALAVPLVSENWMEHWLLMFTETFMRRIFQTHRASEEINIASDGNCFVAIVFLHGFAREAGYLYG